MSQRDLANKSGVAHHTIGQIERGERKARPSTTQKLADALSVAPFILASTIDELGSYTEAGLLEAGATKEHIDFLRAFFISYGYALEATEWEDKKSASYEGLLEAIDLAQNKLKPSQEEPIRDQLVKMTEAILHLSRASARLLQVVTNELQEQELHTRRYHDDELESQLIQYRNTFGRFSRPLSDAWLEGAAATKGFIDITDKASRLYNEKALEEESENEGGDHQE